MENYKRKIKAYLLCFIVFLFIFAFGLAASEFKIEKTADYRALAEEGYTEGNYSIKGAAGEPKATSVPQNDSPEEPTEFYFSGGSGTEQDPYLIGIKEQLCLFSKIFDEVTDRAVTVGGPVIPFDTLQTACYKLTSDIRLNDETFTFDPDTGLIVMTDGMNTAYIGTRIKGESGGNTTFDNTPSTIGKIFVDKSATLGEYSGEIERWTPIGCGKRFNGKFDGGGFTISGIFYSNIGVDQQGLFGSTGTDALIENVTVADSFQYASQFVGGVVGLNRGVVRNSANLGFVFGNVYYVGGVVGCNDGLVLNCYNSGILSVVSNAAGGIAGNNTEIISNCYNIGKIYGYYKIGAIAGINSDTISNSYYLAGSATDGSLLQFGVGGETNNTISPDTGTLIGFSQDRTLIFEVEAGAYTGTDLLQALNGWAVEQGTRTYRKWKTEAGVNGGYPVFRPLIETSLTIYYNGSNLLENADVTLTNAKGAFALDYRDDEYILAVDEGIYNLYAEGKDTGAVITVTEEDLTVYLYTLTYDANGAWGTPPEIRYYGENTEVTVSGNTDLEKTGYDFAGFGLSTSAETVIASLTIETDPVTLYAVFTLLAPDVTLSPDNGAALTYGSDLSATYTHPLKGQAGASASYCWETDGVTVGTSENYMPDAKAAAYAISCTVTFIYGEDQNSATQTITYTVNKADYDMSGISFVDGSHEYDGQAHSLTVSGTLPTGLDGIALTVSYTGSATNVAEGAVTVTAVFSTTSTNYNTPAEMTAKITITKATLTDTTQNLNVIYDGKEHCIMVSLIGFVADESISLAVLTYSANGTDYAAENIKCKNVGETVVYYRAVFDNYNTVSGAKTIKITARSATVTIDNKSSIEGSPLVPLTYTAQNTVEGDDLNIVLEKEEGTAPGYYQITGTYDNPDYNVTVVAGIYTIRKYCCIVKIDEDPLDRYAEFTCSQGFEPDYTFVVVNRFNVAYWQYVQSGDYSSNTAAIEGFDITYVDSARNPASLGGANVKIKLESSDVSAKGLNVFKINDDGSLSDVNFSAEEEFVNFNADTNGRYVFIADEQLPQTNNRIGKILILVLLFLIILLCLILLIIIIYKQIKQRKR